MNFPPNEQRIVRNIIKEKHRGKYYSDNEFHQTISSLIEVADEKTSESIEVNHDTISEFLAQYTHFSKKFNGYYFNLRKKQTENKNEYTTMIRSYKSMNDIDNLIKIDMNGKDFVVSDKEDIVSDKVDIVSDKEDIVIDKDSVINDKDDVINDKDGLINNKDNNIFVKTEKEISNEPIDYTNAKDNKVQNDSDEEIDTEELKELEEKLFSSFTVKQIKKPSNESYKYPIEKVYDIVKRTNEENGPYGTQWVHDVQCNDKYDDILEKRAIQFDKLRAVILPEQRSPEWFKMRHGAITASDGGCVLGHNKYEPQYNFIVKKCIGKPFQSNKFCYHGKKLEEIATMIYEYRMNVIIEEFGLMMHPTIPFLGASPDGICSRYKLDGTTRSKYVGRMLEIKCPLSREIKMDGPIKDHICPIYYWIQVQLQLECCDLEECDFWQCDLREYKNRYEFIKDTDPNEPFRSKSFSFEKGCLIQLIPKNRIKDTIEGKYFSVIFEDAIFIYPPKIEMTPYDCDVWVADQMAQINLQPKYFDYVFDKVIYWRLEKSKNVTIKRDRKWFADNYPTFKKMWDYVEFFRNNEDKLQIFKDYLDSRPKKINDDIMNVIAKLYNTNAPNYTNIVANILKNIDINKEKKEKKLKEKSKYSFDNEIMDSYKKSGYMFTDDTSSEESN